MQPLPHLYTKASGARAGGISIGTFNKRVVALGIEPCANLFYGRAKQPLFHDSDVSKIVGPYVSARSVHKFPSVAALYTPTRYREGMKAAQEEALAAERAAVAALEEQRKAERARVDGIMRAAAAKRNQPSAE